MIYAEYSHRNRIHKLKITGHAGTAPKGQDLVCCSVSTLCLTLSQCILNNKDKLTCEPVIKLSDGSSVIECEATGRSEKEIMHFYYVVAQGLAMLAESFPEHIILKKI